MGCKGYLNEDLRLLRGEIEKFFEKSVVCVVIIYLSF